MTSKVFEILLIEHPTKEAADKGEKPEIIGEVQYVIAKDQQTAVAKLLQDEIYFKLDLDRVEVKVRLFQ